MSRQVPLKCISTRWGKHATVGIFSISFSKQYSRIDEYKIYDQFTIMAENTFYFRKISQPGTECNPVDDANFLVPRYSANEIQFSHTTWWGELFMVIRHNRYWYVATKSSPIRHRVLFGILKFIKN